jgi:hypothetical protein
MWKVGDVMSVNVADGGYGFNVTTDRGKPLVLFAYETRRWPKLPHRRLKRLLSEPFS